MIMSHWSAVIPIPKGVVATLWNIMANTGKHDGVSNWT